MAEQKLANALKRRVGELPEHPGVYLFKDSEKHPLYIGKALSIRKRVLSHFRYFGESFSKEGRMLNEVSVIDFIETPSEAEALLLEASLIKENQPKYNHELKDDKSYPFLKITAEEFPRLLVVRSRKADGGKYFGPYTSSSLLRQAVSMLRRLFPMRTCNPLPDKVCLMYHIRQCEGPCVDEIDTDRYGEIVRELELFLQGRRDILVRNLFKRMRQHSAKREYEQAGSIFEEIKALSAVPQAAHSRKQDSQALANLRQALALPRIPSRIEGFDISNISGREAVGSVVVFVDGKPSRKDYRRFRIKTVKGIDDYQMMREVVRRRYTRALNEKETLPDLVVIDGGKGHLGAAKLELDALNLGDLPVLSIAKQHETLFSPDREKPYVFPQSSPHLQLVQHLRDEAHRFAINYHRRLHKKEALISALDEIPGVGPKTKQKLLKKFGTISKVKALSEKELAALGGLNKRVARNIEALLKNR